MYCPKCGKELPDNAKFCSGCGAQIQSAETNSQTAPTAQPSVNNPTVQTTQQPANNPAGQSAQQAQPVNPDAGAQQPVQPVNYNQAPVQPQKPKKPMSKKAKLAILFSSIGAVVVAAALIVVFAVVLPSINKVDVSDYIDVGFNKMTLYDGEIESVVAIDRKELVSANDMDTSESYDNFESLLGDNDWPTIVGQLGYPDYSDLTYVLSHCNISVHKKGDDGNTETCSGDEALTLNGLKKDDVLVVDITWDDSSYAQKEINYYQKELGVNFDTSDKSVEIKVSDRLEKFGFELKEKVNVDFFAKLDELGAVRTIGVADGDLTFEIEGFTFEQGGYTFTKDGEDSNVVEITGDDDDSWILFFDKSETDDLSDGDTVNLSLSYNSYYDDIMQNRLDTSDVFFTETEKTYTIKRNTPLTADDAKENIDLIKEQMTDYISKEAFYDTRKIEIREIYYSEPKTADTANVDFNRFIFVYYDKDDKDYNVYTCDNAYILNDDFLASNPRSEFNFDNDTIKEIRKNSDALNDKDRKITKIA